MAHNVTRRDVLQRAAAVGAAAAIPSGAFAQARGSSEPFANLTNAEARVLESIVGRLIPRDENGPGAIEAGAARYIDRSLSSAFASSIDSYRAGLAAVDALARARGGQSFADLDVAVQDQLLAAIERGDADSFTGDAAGFFTMVLNHTIEGTFCDPAYGGNEDFIGWSLIGYPGIRLAVGAEQQRMGARLELNRISAYDLPMFEDEPTAKGDGNDR